MQQPDDLTLLERWRKGDRASGEMLFERHFASLYRFFANKVEVGVEDLIQQTLLGTLEAADRFRADAAFRTYLFAVARNQLFAHFRSKQKMHGHMDVDQMSIHDMEPSPSAVLAGRVEQRLLLEALRRLPIDMQICIELHYWEGLGGQELASVLQVPVNTAHSRLRRAKLALREMIEALDEDPVSLHATSTELDTWAQSLKLLVSGPAKDTSAAS